MIRSDVYPLRVDGVEEYGVVDELLLYHSAWDCACSLNTSAREIWILCDGLHKVDTITKELGERCGRAPEEIQGDIERAILQLESLGVVKLCERPVK